MFRCLLLLLALTSFNLSEGFGFSPSTLVHSRRPTRCVLVLSGWFDFKPFQGSGSAKEDLDEQWEAQQEILRARRNMGLDKEQLKKKYKAPKEVPPVEASVKPAGGEMTIPKTSVEKNPPAPFKLPWEK